MKKQVNQDGSTTYTLSQTEKIVLWSILSYFYGRRVGFYHGRRTMAAEIQRTGKPQS